MLLALLEKGWGYAYDDLQKITSLQSESIPLYPYDVIQTAFISASIASCASTIALIASDASAVCSASSSA